MHVTLSLAAKKSFNGICWVLLKQKTGESQRTVLKSKEARNKNKSSIWLMCLYFFAGTFFTVSTHKEGQQLQNLLLLHYSCWRWSAVRETKKVSIIGEWKHLRSVSKTVSYYKWTLHPESFRTLFKTFKSRTVDTQKINYILLEKGTKFTSICIYAVRVGQAQKFLFKTRPFFKRIHMSWGKK